MDYEFSFLRSALYPLATRLLREEENVGLPRNLMERAKEEINRYQNLVDKVKLDEPSTVLQLVDRLIDENMPEEKVTTWEEPRDVIKAKGLTEYQYPSGIRRSISAQKFRRKHLVIEGEKKELWKIAPGVYLESSGDHTNRATIYIDGATNETFYDAVDFSVKDVADGLMREALWAGHRTMKIGYTTTTSNNTFAELSNYDLGTTEYIGPLEDLIEPIVSMLDEGHRWCLLIQGKPGVGKTTFVKHVAREHIDRFLFVPKEYFKETSASNWVRMMEVISPNAILIDDPDYIPRWRLKEKLRPLEEGESKVPLIFITSNDLSSFPSSMKRPGRIDHIEVAEPPGQERMRSMLEAKAAEFDISVPQNDEYIEELCDVLWEHSPAHLREVFKRASALDWHHDIVFDVHDISIGEEEDEEDEGESQDGGDDEDENGAEDDDQGDDTTSEGTDNSNTEDEHSENKDLDEDDADEDDADEDAEETDDTEVDNHDDVPEDQGDEDGQDTAPVPPDKTLNPDVKQAVKMVNSGSRLDVSPPS